MNFQNPFLNVVDIVVLAIVFGAFIGCTFWLLYLINKLREVNKRLKQNLNETSKQKDFLSKIVCRSNFGIAAVTSDGKIINNNPQAEYLKLVTSAGLAKEIIPHLELTKISNTSTQVEIQVSTPSMSDGIKINRTTQALRCTIEPLEDSDVLICYAVDDTESIRLEKTRRDFVANISHELKTPVGAIYLLAEALIESSDDKETVEHFGKKLLQENIRMQTIINELLVLTRLQGADALPKLSPVSIDDVIDEAINRSLVTAEASNIQIASLKSGCYVNGEKTLLITALSNLISNAVAYSPENTTISVTGTTKNGKIEISVIDNGIGINPEDQERVFERFFRIDKARSRQTGGTGLGLAIVKHVMANHGGDVTLWSKPGAGSTFTLVLPQLTNN